MKKADLKIEYVPIDSIRPYENNAKLHPDEQVEQIEESINEFGMCDPIAVWGKDNVIVEGHGRLMALQKKGATEVPIIRLDHLTDKQRKKYALVHNKLTMNSGFDLDMLNLELGEIGIEGMADYGFELSDSWMEEPDEREVEEDKYDFEQDAPARSSVGQIWRLGNHRLMCGDSTNEDHVAVLMGGALVECVCTDPPYNMKFEGAGGTDSAQRKKNRIMNDSMPESEFKKFMLRVYKSMQTAMKDGASCYVFYKELGEGTFITQMKESGLTFKQELVWVKNQIVLGGSRYQNMYEPCLFGCKGKSMRFWYGNRKQRSVIESIDLMNEDELRQAVRELTECEETDVIRERKPLKNDLHPTMKPIKLLAKLLKNSTRTDDCVLDLFGGSGSTLMACEQLKRKCYMMEFDPKYCDVIIDRWEQFTGQKAELLSE